MERLGQRDLEVLLSCLREIYGQLDLDSFATNMVSKLPKVISSEWTSYNEVDAQSRTITWAMDPFPSDFLEGTQIFERHIPEHPLINHYQRTGDDRGKTDKEVATLLYVSPRTVKKHLEHVYEKLGVKSRTEAMARALEILGLPHG